MNIATLFMAGVRALPLVALPAALMIGVTFIKHRKLLRQYDGSTTVRGIVQELGTRNRPYPHPYMLCRLPGAELVEVAYVETAWKGIAVGDEVSLCRLSDGSLTSASYEDEPMGKGFGRMIFAILVICLLLAFVFPFFGNWLLRNAA